MTRWRKGMLALLCGGVFLCGLGSGIAFGEFSNFSYGGKRTLEEERLETQQVTIPVSEDGGLIYLPWQIRDMSEVTFSSEVPEDQVWLQVTYNAGLYQVVPYTGRTRDTDQESQKDKIVEERISLNLEGDDIRVFMNIKDMLLSDLKDRRISSYQVKGIEGVTAVVNPALHDRIFLR